MCQQGNRMIIPTAITISNELIRLSHEAGKSITNMKLQKLLYLSQGIHLALYDSPLFKDNIEAWEYGPCVPNSHYNFKIYFTGEIPTDNPYSKINNIPLNSNQQELIKRVIKLYGDMSAISLSIFLREGSPWQSVYYDNFNISSEITTSSMKIFFKDWIAKNNI